MLVWVLLLLLLQKVFQIERNIKIIKEFKNKKYEYILKDEYSYDKEEARKVQTKFAFTQIKDVLESSEILYAGKTKHIKSRRFRIYSIL